MWFCKRFILSSKYQNFKDKDKLSQSKQAIFSKANKKSFKCVKHKTLKEPQRKISIQF